MRVIVNYPGHCIVECEKCGYRTMNVLSPPNPETPCPQCREEFGAASESHERGVDR